MASTRNGRNTGYNVSSNLNWKTLPRLEIRLDGFPKHFTTWDIYHMVEAFGNIVHVSIKDPRWERARHALVKFQPPPDSAFWEVHGQLGSISATISDNNHTTTVPDPSIKGAQLPSQMRLAANAIEFGFRSAEHQMVSMYCSGQQEVEVALNLDKLDATKNTININFRVPALAHPKLNDSGNHRLQLKLNRLSSVFLCTEGETSFLVLPCELPPEMHRKSTDIRSTHQKDMNNWSEWDAWIRQTDIVLDKRLLRQQPARFESEDVLINIGRWITYRLAFDQSKTPLSSVEQMLRVLSRFNIQVHRQSVEIQPPLPTSAWSLVRSAVFSDKSPTTEYIHQLEALQTTAFNFSFETQYQLEVCVSHGYLHESSFTEAFLERLQDLDRHDRTRAVGILEQVAVLKRRFFDPMEIFTLRTFVLDTVAMKKAPRHCSIARSATITPTMIYLNSPGIEVSNRVIRGYESHADRFLRVRFSDEKHWGQIKSRDGDRNDEIYDRIRQVMENGIELADRKYEFLAFGNSQFRDRGAYFFAPTKGLTCANIRSMLGEMNGADRTIPAKFCARLGQNFSTTRGLSVTVSLKTRNDKDQILLPDVKRNGFNFSDGVGKISTFLAKMIAAEFKLPTEDAPSVFQFRLGGCKGVLAVDPALSSHDVYIRPSQYKFAAVHHGLEIIRTSSFASAHLNRQIILVLSALGVCDEVFRSKMERQVNALELALSDETVALNELQKAVDSNQVTLTLASMVQNGFMASKEPFMMSMLQLWRSWSLKYLKEKAKIPIEHGAFLLGTVDETATLRGHYNDRQPGPADSEHDRIEKLPEVFCYIDRKRPGVYEAVQGVCILARNPSLHPGDIRVVRAVDVPHLHHLKNTIVFPQTGDRDISNMCSGGDLDGDDYMLIWDEELIPREWNHAPMDFTAAKPERLGHEVTVQDMTDFFVEYMKSDRLALIATYHLALADWEDDGVKSQKCLELAQLHSLAVDYPKSGVAVRIPQHLKVKNWPHFTERKYHYKSKKILGQLFDLVDMQLFAPDYNCQFDHRIIDAFDHSEDMLKKAESIKSRYDNRIQKIMAQHGIATEFEVWSAFVMKHNQEKKDYTFAEELGTLMEAIRTSFREECESVAGGRDAERLHPFVSAMYAVTAKQVQDALQSNDPNSSSLSDPNAMPMMSFPWLFMQELGKIARGGAQLRDSVHRVQGTQKRHHTTGRIGGDEDIGHVETIEGVVPAGEVLQPFKIQSSSGAVSSDGETPKLLDEHEAMIEQGIRGQLPDRSQTRRDVIVQSLQQYHRQNGAFDFDHETAQGLVLKGGSQHDQAREKQPNASHNLMPCIVDGSMDGIVKVELQLEDSDDD